MIRVALEHVICGCNQTRGAVGRLSSFTIERSPKSEINNLNISGFYTEFKINDDNKSALENSLTTD